MADNKKDDSYYIEKILTDLKFIMDHTAEKTKTDLSQDEVLLDSIMFRIIQIAENSNRLTPHFLESHPDVPWYSIRGMRNRIVHAYGDVNLTIVFDTVTRGIPEMFKKLSVIIK